MACQSAFCFRPEVRSFLLIQLAGGFLYGLARFYCGWNTWLSLSLVMAWGILAARFWHAGSWWLGIHALFPWLAYGAFRLDISPGWYLLAFVFCWLIFGQVARSGVPLYLSNRQALDSLREHLPEGVSFLDVGAGTGTVLASLARTRSDLALKGVEHAWLPWLVGKYRLPSSVDWQRGDYRTLSFANVDVLYAFLSPLPMPDLWQKARQEMKPGSWLISNTFEIPGQKPDEIIELNDWKQGRLLIWRI